MLSSADLCLGLTRPSLLLPIYSWANVGLFQINNLLCHAAEPSVVVGIVEPVIDALIHMVETSQQRECILAYRSIVCAQPCSPMNLMP